MSAAANALLTLCLCLSFDVMASVYEEHCHVCAGMTVSVTSVTKRKTEEANRSAKAGEEVEEIRSDPDAECHTSCREMFTIVCCCGCHPSLLLYQAAYIAASRGLATQMNLLMFECQATP